MGFLPLVTFVGTRAEWSANPMLKLVLDETEKTGARVRFAEATPGYDMVTVSTALRFVQIIVGTKDEDYVLTSDMDMFPIDREFFLRGDPNKLVFMNADAYNGPSGQWNYFPMCYIGAKVRLWKDILRLSGETMEEVLAALLKEGCDEAKHLPDEIYFTEKVRKVGHFDGAEKLVMIGSNFRIDRSNWPTNFDISGKKDAHLPRPGYNIWASLRKLFSILMKSDVKWADDYVAKFCAAIR
jgi:hypothetical protein